MPERDGQEAFGGEREQSVRTKKKKKNYRSRASRLREVVLAGRVHSIVRASRITEAWAEQKVVREIMVFLHSHGVGTARAVRIYKTYGADAVQVMTENPYCRLRP